MVCSPSPFSISLYLIFPLIILMKAASSLGCYWKQELGHKVLIWDWPLYQKHGVFKPECVFQSARHVNLITICSVDCSIVSCWSQHFVIMFASTIMLRLQMFFLFCFSGYFVVSGMLELWQRDWQKEHGETPTPPGLWATAVFVMYHWDLRLPLETLSTFPWWHHQGERVGDPLLWMNTTFWQKTKNTSWLLLLTRCNIFHYSARYSTSMWWSLDNTHHSCGPSAANLLMQWDDIWLTLQHFTTCLNLSHLTCLRNFTVRRLKIAFPCEKWTLLKVCRTGTLNCHNNGG